jgi:cytochrome o ubiquinol oxidase operon protein cyoD|uniref:Cytochrome bo(3) ubiquinol oxidase subunit 4 n=1 Tax=Desulfobacca acetoxidans TaxID=60893 RepID=A0A7V6A418_9BACT
MSKGPLASTGAAGGTIATCLTGLVLALILTAIPFALVMSGALPLVATLWAIGGAGMVQIAVHVHFFLHVDSSSEARWNLVAILYTLFIMALFVGGSLWIMYDLHWRMM